MAKNKLTGIDTDAILCRYCLHYEEAIMRGKEEIPSLSEEKKKKFRYWRLCPEIIEQVNPDTIACIVFKQAKYFWCDNCCQRITFNMCEIRQQYEDCENHKAQCHSLKSIFAKNKAELAKKTFRRVQITEE